VLALSNEPQQLIELVVDKLLRLFRADCCWVQLFSEVNHDLHLVAYRGFTREMKEEQDLNDSGKNLGHRVILGTRVVIPDLTRNGQNDVPSFNKAGFRSLIAVPIKTYRTHGIVGISSRIRNRFSSESAELLEVVAGLLGAAINTAELNKVARDDIRKQLDDEKLKNERLLLNKQGVIQEDTSAAPDDVEEVIETESTETMSFKDEASEGDIVKVSLPSSTDNMLEEQPEVKNREEDLSTVDSGESKEAFIVEDSNDEGIIGVPPEIVPDKLSEGVESDISLPDIHGELSQIAIGADGQSGVTYGKHARKMAEFRQAHNR